MRFMPVLQEGLGCNVLIIQSQAENDRHSLPGFLYVDLDKPIDLAEEYSGGTASRS